MYLTRGFAARYPQCSLFLRALRLLPGSNARAITRSSVCPHIQPLPKSHCPGVIMKFASFLATLSLAASTFAVYVTSADGTQIWAEATGNPQKPAVVFIPGFSCSSLAFNKQWNDSSMTSNLYMVSNLCNGCHRYRQVSHQAFNRFVMMFAVRASADSHSPTPPTSPKASPTISKPSLTTSALGRRGQFWLAGT